MSLGRELSLYARAALGSDERGVARSRREDEPIAWPHRNASVGETEIDRAARAIENLCVAVLVLRVGIARRVRPPIHITSFAPERSLDRAGIGRRGFAVATMLRPHGFHDAALSCSVRSALGIVGAPRDAHRCSDIQRPSC